jgi:acetylornithine deacetylase/succinyl-diaminopimelate desuccinylase-like protein
MKKIRLKSVIFCIIICQNIFAQSNFQQSIRQYWQGQQHRLLVEFRQLVSIPNVVTDTSGITQTADFVQQMMVQRGIPTQRLHGRTPGVPPALFGEVNVPGATKTVIFYAHYDGQPVNPNQWAEGLKPFEATLYDGPLYKNGKAIPWPQASEPFQPNWRLYGRSTSDDKGGVFAILNGYEALVNTGFSPNINVKFFFEGEEEAGSTHLPEILDLHRDKLQADLWVICDGPVHQSGRKQVVFGVRGDANVNLTVYGPKRPLHSGHYGNWIPNPAMKLAQLLASMKDAQGRVQIAGFYDDVIPLTPAERQAMADVPNIEGQLLEELGVAIPEGAGASLLEQLCLPSLNINGIQSANVGRMASNVIPTVANAVLDLRLVLGNDAKRQVEKVRAHARAQGFYVTTEEPTEQERLLHPNIVRIWERGGGYNAQRTPMDFPMAQWAIKAVQTTTNEPVVRLPSLGGSLPLYMFEQLLKAQPITIGIANYDNNQHAENENIRLQNLWDGLETYAALMRMTP